VSRNIGAVAISFKEKCFMNTGKEQQKATLNVTVQTNHAPHLDRQHAIEEAMLLGNAHLISDASTLYCKVVLTV